MSDPARLAAAFKALFEERRLLAQEELLAGLEDRIPEAAAELSGPDNLLEALRAGYLLGVTDALGRLDGTEALIGEALALSRPGLN